MPRKGRDTIIRHVDRANNCIDNYLNHIMQIDGLYAGTKLTDDDGEFIEVEIPPVSEGEPYHKQREFIQILSGDSPGGIPGILCLALQ